jgi:hypothetical protein
MASGKFILTDGYVLITGPNGAVDLSAYAHNIDTPSTKSQEDVSGFNPQASKEFLPGPRDDTVTLQFRQAFSGGTSAVHGVFSNLYSTGGTFTFDVRAVSPTTNSTVSVTNPAYRGTAVLYDYNGISGELGAVGETTVTLKPAPNTFFSYQTS